MVALGAIVRHRILRGIEDMLPAVKQIQPLRSARPWSEIDQDAIDAAVDGSCESSEILRDLLSGNRNKERQRPQATGNLPPSCALASISELSRSGPGKSRFASARSCYRFATQFRNQTARPHHAMRCLAAASASERFSPEPATPQVSTP